MESEKLKEVNIACEFLIMVDIIGEIYNKLNLDVPLQEQSKKIGNRLEEILDQLQTSNHLLRNLRDNLRLLEK